MEVTMITEKELSLDKDTIGSSDLSSDGDENKERGNWTRKADFLLSCIGFAVGLGNLWRFPYLCMRNGGGAFLIPYFTFLLLCGIPLFFLEMALGQFSSSSPLSMWDICPLFKGLGYGMLIVSGLCAVYYNVIITWVIYYLVHSFTTVLPWGYCSNTTICMDHDTNSSAMNRSQFWAHVFSNGTSDSRWNYANMTDVLENNGSHYLTNATDLKKMTPAEEYWQYSVLQLSDGIENMGSLRWQILLCLIAAWVGLFFCLCKGVKSSGKVVYVTAVTPYVFLVILLVRGVTLDGAVDGVLFYITPEWSRLASFQVWGEAALQIFYSLGPAWGGLITMSSYNKFHNNVYRDSIIVPLINCFTSFFGGFVIFSVIGFMAKEAKLPIKDVITQGPGLAFVAYPEAINMLPISPFWAICFFLTLLTIGVDTQFGMVETIISCVADEYPKYLQKRKTLLCGVICFVMMLLGIPYCMQGGMYLFQVMDWYCAAFSVMSIAFFECVVVAWIYGASRLRQEIGLMVGSTPTVAWEVLWRVITPVVMLAVLVFSLKDYDTPTYGSYRYPNYVIGIGWAIASCSIIPLPVYMVYAMIKAEGSFIGRLNSLLRPAPSWGPALKKYRNGYSAEKGFQMPLEMYSVVSDSPVSDMLLTEPGSETHIDV